jgi:hypothetical protein
MAVPTLALPQAVETGSCGREWKNVMTETALMKMAAPMPVPSVRVEMGLFRVMRNVTTEI